MNATHKLARDISRSIQVLEGSGYRCIRISGGAFGEFDIIGLSSTDVMLCKSCRGKPPWAGTIAELRHVIAPPNTRRMVHRWLPRARLPQVIVL